MDPLDLCAAAGSRLSPHALRHGRLLCWVWLCSLLGRVAEKTLVVPKALLGADARGGAFCALG